MELSVVIVNFNTAFLVKRCLSSIIKSSKDLLERKEMEIIMVDNGSSDQSIEMLKKEFPSVLLISNKDNEGYGKANNQGIKKAKGKYILLLNSDIKVLENGITKILEFARESKESIAGGKLFNADGSPQASCGPFYSLPIVFFTLFLKGDKLGITRYSPKKITEVDWVSGACIIAKKKVFEKVGFFDENIFMYMEEIDFLYRAKKLGFKVFFYPHARFIHIGSGSSHEKIEPVLNIYKGLAYFYKKHRTKPELFLLRVMLKLKAFLGIVWGYLTSNSYLKKTYAKAFKLA